MSKIEYIQIFGERNSGTHFITQLFRSRLKNIEVGSKFGWKHGFVHDFTLTEEEQQKVLVVCVFKNPYAWFKSMHKKPYYAPQMLKLNFSGFLRATWICYKGKGLHDRDYEKFPLTDKNEWLIERNPIRKNRIANVVYLRNNKNKYFLELKSKIKNVEYIKYEDLLKNDEKIINEIASKYNLEKRVNYKKVDSKITSLSEEQVAFDKTDDSSDKEYLVDYSLNDLKFINKILSDELENEIGYKKISTAEINESKENPNIITISDKLTTPEVLDEQTNIKKIWKINNLFPKQINIEWQIKTFKNAYLYIEPGIDGVVLDQNFNVIQEQFKFVRPLIFKNNYKEIKHLIKNKEIKSIESLNLFFDPAWKNLYHFFIIFLPKYFEYSNIKNTEETLYLPNPSNFKNSKVKSHFSLNKVIEVLDLLKISNYQFLNRGVYKINELNLLTNDIKRKQIYTDFFQNSILNKFLFEDESKNLKKRKVFLTRKGSLNAREYDNVEVGLIGKYLDKDYEIIDFGKLTFSDQVKTINECSSVAGIHGAALTNILFAKHKLNIIEFGHLIDNEKSPRSHYAEIALIKGHNYKFIQIDN